jgi:hypothetical protein
MSALAQFDDAFAQPVTLQTQARVANGFYTVTFPDGSHRTFRVYTRPADSDFAPGKRVAALLIGPRNTEDFEPFAWVDDTGIQVWKRFRGAKDNPSQHERHTSILWKLATGEVLEGHELQLSKRCLVCNRTLTDPTSISLGIGPSCRRTRHG